MEHIQAIAATVPNPSVFLIVVVIAAAVLVSLLTLLLMGVSR